MKILVTGGAGYIGSVATAELIVAGHDVVVVDNLYQGHREAVHSDAQFIHGDLADMDAVKNIFVQHTGFDAVMHFASYTLVGESMQNPAKYLRDNTVAGVNIIDAAVAAGVERVIVSSTANLFEKPDKMPIEPDNTIVPGSPYGESKYILERTLHWYERIHGLKYACLRYFNAAGGTPNRGEDHTPELHLIPVVLQVALGQRESITLFGGDYATRDGTCVRDYVHIVDLAQAHILALDGIARLGSRKYNLGNGDGFTNLEVVQAARRITGHAIPCTIGERRPGDPAVLIASSKKIREELGWEPRYPSIDQIIGSAWDWHLNHPKGYRTK
ncbi:MAG: UDP-glucose 4-epimerase GalE [Chloroflexales bacterium]|nr:UDP-glucose 4-epimerase GalE [Chloroflexales bacterium]